jgi:hypothetical protein
MDIATTKPESMTLETSAFKSIADITVKYNRSVREVVLDLRQLPAIKIDAVARLWNPNLNFVYKDFNGCLSLLVNVLFNRYDSDILQAVNAVFVRGDYEVVMVVDPSKCDIPSMLIQDMGDFLKDEAGIACNWGR